MLGPVLPVLTFVALAQARAIVTNHCSYNVYVWSVPQVLSSSHTDNVPIKPGGQYQEPWRHGSIVNPGVAIKISTKSDGILKFADEIDFAYAVDGNDDSKIWVDLSPVRGDAFKDNLAFHSCLTQYGSSNVQTHQCTATDDVELVLCDTSPRSTPEKDPKTLEQVKACYDYHHVLPEDHDGLQVAADDDTESDEDTDCCESRDGPSVEFTYSMAITVESMLAPSSVSSTKVHSPTNVTSTTSSTSSVRLFTPPAAREIDCPGCEKLLILSPCLARVVYPARRRAPATPRHTPDAITPQRGANPPLCEIIQMYHSGFEDCDEAAIESYARSLYPKICEPEFSSLLMGFPCEEVMEELKKVYPDIDAPKVSRTTCKCDADCDFCGHFNDTCICAGANAMAVRDDIQPLPTNVEAPIITPKEPRIGLFSVCGPTLYVADSTMVVDLLDAITLFNERYENWVNEVLGSCNAVSVLPNQDGKHGVCLADLCGLYPTSCDGIRALVTSATKAKFDKDGVYLANRDVCAKWEDSFLGED